MTLASDLRSLPSRGNRQVQAVHGFCFRYILFLPTIVAVFLAGCFFELLVSPTQMYLANFLVSRSTLISTVQTLKLEIQPFACVVHRYLSKGCMPRSNLQRLSCRRTALERGKRLPTWSKKRVPLAKKERLFIRGLINALLWQVRREGVA